MPFSNLSVALAMSSPSVSTPPPAALTASWFGLTYINVIWQEKMVSGMLRAFLGSFIVVLVMMSLGLMYLPSTNPKTAAFSQDIQDAFSTILDFSPRFVFGSLLAYLISQRFDVWAFHKIKAWTGDRWLWLRNNGSTMASQALDTTIYSLIVWWGTVDLRTALALGAAKYLFKLVIAAIDTVFLYWARSSFLKQQPQKTLAT